MLKILVLSGLLLVSGCTTTMRPALGESATIAPGWSRLQQSSKQAFSDPNVWATLLAAVILQADDLDRDISDQLREHTPVFGSTVNADEASDDLQALTRLAYVSTALVVPGPEPAGEWLATKTKLLGSEWLAVKSAGSVTSGLKSLAQRERPNGENKRSFPSGHATSSSIQAQMAKLNVEYLPVDAFSKQALGLSFDSVAALTAWARVEAGGHYPADVLAGWAVAHFVAQLAQDFIDPDRPQVLVMPLSTTDSIGALIVFRF